MNQARKRREEINFISRLSGFGGLSQAQTNNLYGFNHRQNGNPVPVNSDNYGLTFFTRPRLNLSYDNLSASRLFAPLQSQNSRSLPAAIRALLDHFSEIEGRHSSPLVDRHNPFIPMMTNNLVSMSGWPDIALDTYTSKEGVYKEAWSMVDGTSEINNTFDVTATFRNTAGDPITLLITAWVHYMAKVYNGEMVPYPDAIVQNKIDYNTRIYRLVLDKKKRFVQKIGACGASFPMASPIGSAFNFSNETPFNRETDQISVPFRCMGAMYMDPILVYEFNRTVQIFNSQMRDESREETYSKLNNSSFNYFNYRGYPRIDPDTYELEWWVPKDSYNNFIEQVGGGATENE